MSDDLAEIMRLRANLERTIVVYLAWLIYAQSLTDSNGCKRP